MLRNSWRIGSLAGIDLKLHVTFPLVGVALLARQTHRPAEELWVALAGPAVNVALAALLLVGLGLAPGALSGRERAEVATS